MSSTLELTATPVPPATHPSIREALQAIRAEIGPVGKHGRNEEAGYDFRSLDDIVDACSEAFQRHGVLTVPNITKAEYRHVGSLTQAFLHITYAFEGLNGDKVEAHVIGEAASHSDKATNAAMSAAYKYALVQVLMIRSAAMEDSDRHQPQIQQTPALDWYLQQLRRPEVWNSPQRLKALHEWAGLDNMLGTQVPGEAKGTLLGSFISTRGEALIKEQKERGKRQSGEKAAAGAQLRAEHPDPPGHDARWATPGPSTPQGPSRPEGSGTDTRPGEIAPDQSSTPSGTHPPVATSPPGDPSHQQPRRDLGEADGTLADSAAHTGPPPTDPDDRIPDIRGENGDEPEAGEPAPEEDASSALPEPSPPSARRTPRGAMKLVLGEAETQAAILGLPLDAYLLTICEPDADPAALPVATVKTFVTRQRARAITRLIELGHTDAAGRYADLGQTAPVSLPDVLGWTLSDLGINPTV